MPCLGYLQDLGNVKTLFDLLMKEEQAEKLRTRLIVVVILFSQKVHDSGLKQLTNRQCRSFGASKFPSSTNNYLQS